jgi:hypothetical protein
MQPPVLPPSDTTGTGSSGAPSTFPNQLSGNADINPDHTAFTLPGLPAFSFPFQCAPIAADIAPGPRRPKRSNKPKLPKTQKFPPELEIDGQTSNQAFQAAMDDACLSISPEAHGFLPSNYWVNQSVTFNEMVTKFFQRKNNANCRFPHKLYNALTLVDRNPIMQGIIGVEWVTDQIFKVDKLIFGRLLGINAIDGGLFHRQGNFPSHGFVELNPAEVSALKSTCNVADVDGDRIRLMYHKGGDFGRHSTEDAVTDCKWITEAEPRQ